MTELELMKRRIDMAAGRCPADLLIRNAKVVNVFTGEVLETPVAVGEGAIVGFAETEALETIDAAGTYLLPGFIDSHIHVESTMASPERFAELVVPHGTTTVIADPHEIVNVAGVAGIDYLLEAAPRLPLNLLVAVPSCVPALAFEEAGAILEAEDMSPYMNHSGVASVGEMMNFPAVIAGEDGVLRKILLGHRHRKPVDGHAPGVLGRNLDAYLTSGIANTHECTTVEEMRENLRRGSRVFMRHGSAAKDAQTLLSGVTAANSRRCSFCSDDRHSSDLLREGHLDYVLRMAVESGLDAVTAVTMCTLNAAEAAGLSRTGAIAPGYDADFVFVNNLTEFKVLSTWRKGIKVAEHGHLCVEPEVPLMPELMSTMNPAALTVEHLALSIPTGKARVIGLEPHTLVTPELLLDVNVDAAGFFQCALNPTLSKVAVVERHKGTGHVGVGLVHGYGIVNGAIATSIAHDSHNIVVVGDNDADMIAAVDHLSEVGGGVLLCRNGHVIARLPLPIGGLMSSDDPANISSRLSSLISIARMEFSVNPDIEPFMTLSFVSLPVIPVLKLTTKGLFNVSLNEFVAVGV